ncbi:hypothetical protein TNCT_578991 [Trichonephila clavata]|uniref:Uncharacterized protein n=1 Tax=Trichonephila clavata TaxID=2740835 RepID=A0A8X6JKS2_TRICU|nr:hypothetical protein TNCT_578991 [Trichonephila clavata]
MNGGFGDSLIFPNHRLMHRLSYLNITEWQPFLGSEVIHQLGLLCCYLLDTGYLIRVGLWIRVRITGICSSSQQLNYSSLRDGQLVKVYDSM